MATPVLSVFATSAWGHPILSYRFPRERSPAVLILGGVHGDETEGVSCAHGVLAHLLKETALNVDLTIIPAFNIDGVLAKSRLNGNGVDLNRNLPSNDWDPKAFNERYPPGPHACSEPENKALVDFLSTHPQSFILSLHSWKPMLNINGDCEPEASAIQKLTGYSIEPTIGYPTPGSLGTYAGIERNMPTLTYEIERGLALSEVLRVHVPAVVASLRASQTRRI